MFDSKAVKADIVWVVTQSSVAEGSKGNRRIERSAAVTIAITNKLYNDLLIMLPSFFDHGRTKQRSLSLLSDSEEISATGEHVTSDGKYNGSLYSNFSSPLDGLYTVLEVTNVSLPELEILTTFQAQRTPTAFLSISSLGQADAIITNYRVSKSSLRSIFFNQLGPSNCSSDAKVDDRSTEITGLTTMSQIISFPDVDIIDGDVNEEEEDLIGEEETEDGNNFYQNDDESGGGLANEILEDEGEDIIGGVVKVIIEEVNEEEVKEVEAAVVEIVIAGVSTRGDYQHQIGRDASDEIKEVDEETEEREVTIREKLNAEEDYESSDDDFCTTWREVCFEPVSSDSDLQTKLVRADATQTVISRPASSPPAATTAASAALPETAAPAPPAATTAVSAGLPETAAPAPPAATTAALLETAAPAAFAATAAASAALPETAAPAAPAADAEATTAASAALPATAAPAPPAATTAALLETAAPAAFAATAAASAALPETAAPAADAEATTAASAALPATAAPAPPAATTSATVTASAATEASSLPSLSRPVLQSALELLVDPSVKVVHKIEDVSLGLRLMNSYRLAYQKGTIRVPKVPRHSPSYNEDDEDDDDEHSGDKKDAGDGDDKNNNKKDGKNNRELVREHAHEVRVSGSIWAWHDITSYSYIQAILPLHSVSAVAVHQGEESLYGVAFTSLHTLGNTNRMVSMVDGVTLLPPGGLWISLALSCIGYDPQSVIEFETTRFKELRMERQKQKLEVKAVWKVEKLKKNTKKSRKLLEEMMALQIGPNIGNYDFTPCHTVRRYIVQGADCIKRDDNLIDLIDGIFKGWTDVDRQVKL